MAKKYFWLKIQEDFFRQKEIKALRKMERGASYIIIYQKMLVHSLQNNNKLYFDNVEDSFEEEIALTIDEEVEDVKTTLEFLKKTHLIECATDDEMELLQVEELTGEECESLKRVRKHRMNKKKTEENNKPVSQEENKELVNNQEDKKEVVNNKEENKTAEKKSHDEKSTNDKSKGKDDENFCNADVMNCNGGENFCNKSVTLEKEKELDKDLEKEIESEPESELGSEKITSMAGGHDGNENLKKITSLYEQNIGPIYPSIRQWFLDICDEVHWRLFENAIEICIDSCNVTPSYLKGIIRRCINENIHTLEEFNAKKMEFINKKYRSKKMSEKESADFQENNQDTYEKLSSSSKKSTKKSKKEEAIDPNMLKKIEEMEAKLGVS